MTKLIIPHFKDFPFSFTVNKRWDDESPWKELEAEFGPIDQEFYVRHAGGTTFMLFFKTERDAVKAKLMT